MNSRLSPSREIVRAVAPLLLWALVFCAGASPRASAQTFNVIYGFTGGADGGVPGNLALDSAGNIYGTAGHGGNFTVNNQGFESDYGTVFKLAPNGNLSVLHTFSGSDGWQPDGLALDSGGNVYGTTYLGGQAGCGYGNGCGVVFKVTAQGQFSVLHTFVSGTDGNLPESVTADSAGNVYGVTTWGGNNGGCAYGQGCGTIFKVDTQGNLSILYRFTGGNDGDTPYANVVLDSAGNLYGASGYDGSGGAGVVFKLSPSGVFTPLHSFNGNDGYFPTNVVLDSAGNLYGIASGGQSSAGLIYKVNLSTLAFSTVYTFSGGNDGNGPGGSLVFDSAGNLYGTASQGGNSLNNQGCGGFGCGVLFKLTPSGQESTIYNFVGVMDGSYPYGVALDSSGRIYTGTGTGGPFLPAGPGYDAGETGTVSVTTP